MTDRVKLEREVERLRAHSVELIHELHIREEAVNHYQNKLMKAREALLEIADFILGDPFQARIARQTLKEIDT